MLWIRYNMIRDFMIITLGVILIGCATPGSLPPPSPPSPDISEKEILKPPQPFEEPSPRELASLQLTEQGRIFLENGALDDAISVLERAVSLHPNNGQNYYYLAEAWLMKGNILQAEEWNRLAGIYLKEDTSWSNRVQDQHDRIRAQMQ